MIFSFLIGMKMNNYLIATCLTCSWEQGIPLVQTSEEGTWLFHELGRCHLELEEPEKAREYGEKALAAARDSQDKMWQLNTSVLMAQADSEWCKGGLVLRLQCLQYLIASREVHGRPWGGLVT